MPWQSAEYASGLRQQQFGSRRIATREAFHQCGAGRIGQQSGESRLRRERERGTPRLLAGHSIGPAVGQRSVEEL